jgi:hypothetical protein
MIINTFEHPQLCSACDLGKIFLTSKFYQGKHAFLQTQVSNPTFLDLSGFLSIWSNEKSYGSTKLSSTLSFSAPEAKKELKKKAQKACENHIVYFE